MDTRNGRMYPTREDAVADGVPEEYIVTGTPEALENLRNQLVFTKGSFKRRFPLTDDALRSAVMAE